MMPSRRSFEALPLFWMGVALGLVLSVWYASQQIMGGDQLQMIQRGYLGAYQGVWLSVGNTASVVGNVPGSVLAWLVGGPVLIWDSPYAPMLFLLVLRLIGFLLLDNVIRQVFDNRWQVRLIFLVLCWLNPWLLFDSLLYNPSYLIFCAGLHFWSAWQLRQAPKLVPSFLHVLSIGLAMQLHFSWPLLVFISAYLFYRGVLRLHLVGVLLAAIVIFLSLWPYLQQLIADPTLAQNADPEARDRYIGWGGVHVYPVLKAAIYWLRYGSWAFTGQLVNEATFEWISISWLAVMVWRVVLYGLAAITMVVSLIANIYAFKRIKSHWRRSAGRAPTGEQWLLLYVLGAGVAALISAALAPIVFNYWHLTLIFPFALMPILVWLVRVFWRGAEITLWPLCLAVFLTVGINVVALNDSAKFSWQADYAQQTKDYVGESIGEPTARE
jgi:hypothetical protein